MIKTNFISVGMIVGLALSCAIARADVYDADFSGLTLTAPSDGGSGNNVTVSGPGNYDLWDKTTNTHATGTIGSGSLLTFDLVGSTVESLTISDHFGKYSLSEVLSGTPETATGNLAAFESVSGASANLPSLFFDDPIMTSNAFFILDTSGGHSQLDVNFTAVAPTPTAALGAAAIIIALAGSHILRRFNRTARMM